MGELMGARLATPEENADRDAKREQALRAPEVAAARLAIEELRNCAREAAALADKEAHLAAQHLLEEGHDSDVVAEAVGLGRGLVGCMAQNMIDARQRAASHPLMRALSDD